MRLRDLDTGTQERRVGHRHDFLAHTDETAPQFAVGLDHGRCGVHAHPQHGVGDVFRQGLAGRVPRDGEAGVGVGCDPLVEGVLLGRGEHDEGYEPLIFVGGGDLADPSLRPVAGAELDEQGFPGERGELDRLAVGAGDGEVGHQGIACDIAELVGCESAATAWRGRAHANPGVFGLRGHGGGEKSEGDEAGDRGEERADERSFHGGKKSEACPGWAGLVAIGRTTGRSAYLIGMLNDSS